MEKQELLNQKLYYLTVAEYTPLKMNNEFILVYSDCEKLDIAKSNFGKRYGEIHALAVTDNTEFIKQMLLSGCEKFIYNGDGTIYITVMALYINSMIFMMVLLLCLR